MLSTADAKEVKLLTFSTALGKWSMDFTGRAIEQTATSHA
jgi:hypothetical protein